MIMSTPPQTQHRPATAPASPSKPADAAKPDEKKDRPGRKPGQPAKEYDFTGLDADFLSSPLDVPEELQARTAPQRARSEIQLAVDKAVLTKYQAWVTAGKPGAWAKMPKGRYPVAPEKAAGVKYLIRRAGDFHGKRIRFGNPVRDQQGREHVVFAVLDKTRAAKDEKPAEPTVATTEKALTDAQRAAAQHSKPAQTTPAR